MEITMETTCLAFCSISIHIEQIVSAQVVVSIIYSDWAYIVCTDEGNAVVRVNCSIHQRSNNACAGYVVNSRARVAIVNGTVLNGTCLDDVRHVT